MIYSLRHKLLLKSLTFAIFLSFSSILYSEVYAQNGDQSSPGAATLEEQLEQARDKIRQAESAGAYGSKSGPPIGNPISAISDFFNNFLNMVGLTTPGFTKYTDPSGTISFQYPSDWSKISEVSLSNFGVSFGSPPDTNGRSVFTLSSEDSNYLFLDTYKESRVSELQDTNLFGYGFSGIEGPADTTLGWLPAFQIKFISPVLGGLDTIEVYSINKGKLYVASYQGKSEPYQKHIESFNKILDTIEIK
jgi:hypothetical protein